MEEYNKKAVFCATIIILYIIGMIIEAFIFDGCYLLIGLAVAVGCVLMVAAWYALYNIFSDVFNSNLKKSWKF